MTVAGYTTDLLYEDIVDPKPHKFLGHGSGLPDQQVTPFKPIPGYVTNRAGMPPHDATVESGPLIKEPEL